MNEENFGKGCSRDPDDNRDYNLEEIVGSSAPFDWDKGYDIEKVLNFKIPFKDQQSSLSCVGQGWAYKAAVANMMISGKYDEVSAKAIYSKIFQPQGGANIRDGGLITITFGEVMESIVKSHKPDGTVDEAFMEDTSWITPEITAMAKNLQNLSSARVTDMTMEGWAKAIRDNGGVVAGVEGTNNGTWSTNEPKPPLLTTPLKDIWGHCVFFGKAGKDDLGEFVSSPNSWNKRNEIDALHPDDWQKLRKEWFDNNARFLFNPWTLIDKVNKPNFDNMTFKKEKNGVDIYACNDTTKVKCLINDMPTLEVLYQLSGVSSFTEVDSLSDYADTSLKSLLAIERKIN